MIARRVDEEEPAGNEPGRDQEEYEAPETEESEQEEQGAPFFLLLGRRARSTISSA
jgi:hypothetical protein